jgi:hypothetical protein
MPAAWQYDTQQQQPVSNQLLLIVIVAMDGNAACKGMMDGIWYVGVDTDGCL